MPGSIVARVKPGPSSEPMAGIQVQVDTPAGARRAKTDSCGVAIFENLPDGPYAVTAGYGDQHTAAAQASVVKGEDANVSLAFASDLVAPVASPTSGCTPPVILSGPLPQYTADALTHRRQGCLIIKCVITTKGAVRNCVTVEPLEGLTESVLATLPKLHYQPFLCDGKPTEAQYTFRTSFRMPR
jgi:hypothetical protein